MNLGLENCSLLKVNFCPKFSVSNELVNLWLPTPVDYMYAGFGTPLLIASKGKLRTKMTSIYSCASEKVSFVRVKYTQFFL